MCSVSPYCFRALVKCIPCTIKRYPVESPNSCDIFYAIELSGQGQACSAADIAAGNWVQAYWTSQTNYPLGIQAWHDTNSIINILCCNTDNCNQLSAVPQARCLATSTSFQWPSYCMGVKLDYKLCVPAQSSEQQILSRFYMVSMSLCISDSAMRRCVLEHDLTVSSRWCSPTLAAAHRIAGNCKTATSDCRVSALKWEGRCAKPPPAC